MEAELENYKAEMNFLSTQWNRFVREEKHYKKEKEFAEREEKAKQEKIYTEAFEACLTSLSDENPVTEIYQSEP